MSDINEKAYEVQGVAHLLQVNNDGDDGARINDDFRRLMSAVTEHVGEHGGEAKGKMTIVIAVAADARGIDITVSSTAVLPPHPKCKMRYFATDKGDGVTLRNPNRETMFPGADLGRRRNAM